MASLARLHKTGGVAVVTGRRRMGKTHLLLAWCEPRRGIYFVADQSSAEVQRRYFAEAVAERLPGFADVDYRDWRALFARLVADAKAQRFRGPIVIDDVPHLIAAAPELASVLAQFCDQASREARLAIALAGSTRRTMQALAIDADAPLRERVQLVIELRAQGVDALAQALGSPPPSRLLDAYAAWGGVPRYWELAAAHRGALARAVDALVLDPRGVLHDEPTRLLLEELPSAVELRPLLDALGVGATRVSEIAAHIGRPATSLSRALERLRELGLVERHIPFGQKDGDTKRTLYEIVDPFTRLWFRVVAPHRARLARATPKQREALLAEHWPSLRAQAWQQLCREQISVPHKRPQSFGSWQAARPFWQGQRAEWNLVAESSAGGTLLLGDVRCPERTPNLAELGAAAQTVAIKNAPELGRAYETHVQERALFVPELPRRAPKTLHGVRLLALTDLVPY